MFYKSFSFPRRFHKKILYLLFIATLLIITMGISAAQPIQARPMSHTATLWKTWSSLPHSGLEQRVRVFALVGNNLYIGGRFTQTADGTVDLWRIARYDTVADTWNALSNQGLNEEVSGLAVVGSNLYVGGGFTQTVDGAVTNLGYIARYDTTLGTWNALPNQGLDGAVFDLIAVGNDLYAGGTFDQTADGSITNLGGIARYDTVAGTWNALPNQGLNGQVYVLTTDGNDLYVGGNFTQSGDGVITNLGCIVRYDPLVDTWNALPNQGLNGNVNSLTLSGNDLYAGGYFNQTNDGTVLNLNHIAYFDISAGTWNALPNQGLNDQASRLVIIDDYLYVGGTFDQTADGSITDLGYIVRYDPLASTWEALPNQGFNGWVYTLIAVDCHLYVGGGFTQTGDGLVLDLNNIARIGMCAHEIYLPLTIK